MLKKLYDDLIKEYQIDIQENVLLSPYIDKYITSFMNVHNRVAIYCYGWHTQMLMIDYVFQLKGIVAIVDNYKNENEAKGFRIIKDDDIEGEKIDGIIISSYAYRQEIKESLKANHPAVDVLDIYDEFAKDGIQVRGSYYSIGHPYYRYQRINDLSLDYNRHDLSEKKQEILFELIKLYYEIKDFRLAAKKTFELYELSQKKKHLEMANDIQRLYKMELDAFAKVDNNCVVMMCLDGLRESDLSSTKMPRLRDYLDRNSYYFDNAYAYSTSTYESLIPAYSENSNYNSKYFENNEIEKGQCRFINECEEQQRKIYFYTDASKYINADDINYSGKCQTITERMWDFLLDASKESKGFFYIHHLYESHFSFPSPYCSEKIIADGTAMLFDYLPKNGNSLRTDYVKQQKEALHYIDDTLAPMLNRMKCRMVLFADHGNLLLGKNQRLRDINRQYLTCHEDWLRIPFAIITPENKIGRDERLFSLMSINDVIISLLRGKEYVYHEKEYIKCGRSDIYNPDFHFLYDELGEEKRLLAFECFVFEKCKLVVYRDKTMELYSKNDELIDDSRLLKHCFQKVRKEITVCLV